MIWRRDPVRSEQAQALASAAAIHPLIAQLLINRGVETPERAAQFLEPSLERLEDPRALPHIEQAVDRLRRAIAQRELMCVFSDSDVDGLTGSVILYETIRQLGGRVGVAQSNRIANGYGVPAAFVQQLARSPATLLVLVDCGTNQAGAITTLAQQGIETIVVDHHVPLESQCAQPLALVNPYCGPATSLRGLSSAGVAFKLAQALYQGETERLIPLLDVAALGTLADCSPLLGDNRILVTAGLPQIVRSPRIGLQRLCEATNVTGPDPEQIVRRLVPRLNASGRLGESAAVWGLLHSGAPEDCETWLLHAEEAHHTTKRLSRQIIAQAQEQVSRIHFGEHYVMLVSGDGWHRGLMGPLASQLAERYGRPAIALAMDGEEATGSGRSIALFNLLDALQACRGLLVRFGGHAQACGLTISRRNLGHFQELVNQHARQALGPQGLVRSRTADLELPLRAVEPDWVSQLDWLAPFGRGNPRPTVMISHVTIDVQSARRAIVSDGALRLSARGAFESVVADQSYDLLTTPTIVDGELTLLVSGVRDGVEPSAPDSISGTTCTPAPVGQPR